VDREAEAQGTHHMRFIDHNHRHTTKIDRHSSEDTMVATLLGLKASQLAGSIKEEFRVQCLHVLVCAQQAGLSEAVQRRVLGAQGDA